MAPTREQRFEGVFRENYAAVRAYALRRAPRDAAQDVVAETFLVAWRRLDHVPSDALPWLYGVARRVLANERRAADRRGALERRLATATARVQSGGDVEASFGDAELLRAALAQLPDRHREALVLVAWHGLTRARAARAAGCSAATFAIRLRRARARLAAELAVLERPVGPRTQARSLEVS